MVEVGCDRPLPTVYLVRHGQTEWSREGKHTGRTDLALTADGEQAARSMGGRLAGISFDHVFTSPLQRARRTCELAGFKSAAQVMPALVEWDYGRYEGLKTADIRQQQPNWNLFRDGCPNGESPATVAARADDVLLTLRALSGTMLIFSSGHILRVLAARWIHQGPAHAASLALNTASLSILGSEHHDSVPAILLWNECPPAHAANA